MFKYYVPSNRSQQCQNIKIFLLNNNDKNVKYINIYYEQPKSTGKVEGAQ